MHADINTNIFFWIYFLLVFAVEKVFWVYFNQVQTISKAINYILSNKTSSLESRKL